MSAKSSTINNTPVDLDSLRERLTGMQRAILNKIWKCYQEKNSWIVSRNLYSEFKNSEVQASLANLGGSIIFEIQSDGRKRFQLTFLGILLTDQGIESEELLIRCIECLLKHADLDPEITGLNNQVVETELSLDERQSEVLKLLIQLAHPLCITRQFGIEERTWTIALPPDMDMINSNQEIRAYVRDRALMQYDPEMPLDENGRIIRINYRAQERATQKGRTMKIFISHSSKDAAIAVALIDLLRDALNIPPDHIRCTSVNGYRLPGGADTEEQIRNELGDAAVFIGLITPDSLRSAYVLIELGARWWLREPLFLLLASGAGASSLRGPITNINALRCDDKAQVCQMLENINSVLGGTLNAPASYLGKVENLVDISIHQAAQFGKNDGETKAQITEITERPLVRYADARYEIDDNNNAVGDPYCSYCYEGNRNMIHLLRYNVRESICPNCKTVYRSKMCPTLP
jgi:TIR domain-containing protein